MIGLMIGHGAQPSHPANEKYPREERCRISRVTARSRNSCHLRASQSTAGKGDEKKADGAAKTKTPIRYASYQVSPGVHFVSYLAPDSGYTLTVLADTNARVVYAIASSSKEWYPLKGKLEPTG